MWRRNRTIEKQNARVALRINVVMHLVAAISERNGHAHGLRGSFRRAHEQARGAGNVENGLVLAGSGSFGAQMVQFVVLRRRVFRGGFLLKCCCRQDDGANFGRFQGVIKVSLRTRARLGTSFVPNILGLFAPCESGDRRGRGLRLLGFPGAARFHSAWKRQRRRESREPFAPGSLLIRRNRIESNYFRRRAVASERKFHDGSPRFRRRRLCFVRCG